MRHLAFVTCISLLATPLLAGSAIAMSDADNACIDQLRTVGGPDGASGTVLSSEFSEAGTLVMLKDGAFRDTRKCWHRAEMAPSSTTEYREMTTKFIRVLTRIRNSWQRRLGSQEMSRLSSP